MLRISKIADYGTVVMAYLANKSDVPRNARVIAAENHLTLPMVSKVLKLLANAGLLLSERGVQGGYRLAKSAVEISIAQIMAALDNSVSLTECSHTKSGCSLEGTCRIKNHWRVINHTINSALENISVADMVAPSERIKI